MTGAEFARCAVFLDELEAALTGGASGLSRRNGVCGSRQAARHFGGSLGGTRPSVDINTHWKDESSCRLDGA